MIKLNIRCGPNVLEDGVVLPIGSRLRDALRIVKERGYWDGRSVIKVWLNDQPKNDPMKDVAIALSDRDVVRVDIPYGDKWEIE